MSVVSITVPDRYETLVRKAGDNLSHLVEMVPDALAEVDAIFRRMQTAARGAFLVLRGDSGSGKSTFLHTIRFFKEGVETVSVPSNASIKDFLTTYRPKQKLCVYVLEEREATVSFSDKELESWLHEINGFIRTELGSGALVVWPCNTDKLLQRIIKLGGDIGGKSLLGPGDGFLRFTGPNKNRFVDIAEKTLSITNQGASIADLGLTKEQVEKCADSNELIGEFFSDLHQVIDGIQSEVSGLVDKEQCRLWVLVIAGNEPSAEVAGLTRGAYGAIDTERLMSATEANIVAELKKYPHKIGIVGTVLDAKIIHMPVLTATAIARAYSELTLQTRMKARNFSLKPNKKSDAMARLEQSELATLLKMERLGVQQRGAKLGSESKTAFEKLVDIASNNDRELNQCLGRALIDCNLISSFRTEIDFGHGLTRRTDLVCETGQGAVRVEVMWRKRTGRAEIANYTLGKVNNYARAIGFIS